MDNQTQVVVMTLPQVIDVALTGPEMGMVSHRLLNNILQVICQQLHLEDVKMQYQGMQAMQIHKIWNPELKTKLPQVTPVKRTKLTSADENDQEKIVVIPDGPSERFPVMTLAISNTQLQTMERNIRSLQKEVSDLKALPSNAELFKAANTKPGEPSPIVDMYQILTISKRMDATEQAVIKIASFVEDLAKFVQSDDFGGLGEEFGSMADRPPTRSSSIYDKRNSKLRMADSYDAGAMKSMSTTKYPKSIDLGSLGNLATSATRTEKTDHPLVMIKGDIGEEGFTEKRIKERTVKDPRLSEQSSIAAKAPSVNTFQLPESKLENVNVAASSSPEVLALIQEELGNLRSTVDALCNTIIPVPAGAEVSSSKPSPIGSIGMNIPSLKPVETGSVAQASDERICQIEMKMNQCIAQINKMDSTFSTSYTGITHRMADMESSLKLLSNKALQEAGRGDVEEQMTQNIYTVNEKVLGLEGLTSKMSDTVNLLLEENNSKQNKLMGMVEDIDFLKSDKVGREEFTEALSEKVDVCMINRKVSHDQFNATCDDLSRGIEEALEKLMEQEDLWHIALREIQDEISEKLGKDDLSPLKEFVSDKLKNLQLKVKTLTKMKQEQEAAATKSKFLKGVQCISCDQDVIMRKKVDESLNYPGLPVLPPHKNIAPYLAYELDQLRRQQRQTQYGKNLHHFESATRENKGVVNRYCGGSHTITTPQQRVTRIGNFSEQWGPQTLKVDRNSFQCQSDRTERTSLTQKTSRDSLGVRNSKIKFDMAEKDEVGKVPQKSASDVLVNGKSG